jgi:N-glycosylase/DNA lyase
VADCVLLYTGTKDEAFPVDVWILRELLSIFPEFFDERLKKKLKKNQRNKLSLREYEAVSSAAREHFGPYAGYAQLYLYVGARNRG